MEPIYTLENEPIIVLGETFETTQEQETNYTQTNNALPEKESEIFIQRINCDGTFDLYMSHIDCMLYDIPVEDIQA